MATNSMYGEDDDGEPIGRNDQNDIFICAALHLLRRTNTEKDVQDEKNRWIQNLFEIGFEVRNPTGARKISSQKLYQAIWRTANRMKPLDFQIQGSGASEDVEKIVSDGVSTVMSEGNYIESLRGKGGTFFKLLMYGDGFQMVGENPDPDSSVPILYNTISNNNVWVDNYCTAIRGQGTGSNASEMCIIFSYRWHDAIRLYPELEKIGGKGRIPRDDYNKEQDKDYYQHYETEKDLVEVAYYYDIARKRYCVFAGRDCTLLNKKEDDEYPFKFRGTPYLPILQWICMPSSEGFYNHGVGDMLYELALVSSRLFNMEVNHIEDNVYPFELVSVPQGEAANFFQKLAMANESRRVGKKPFIAMEYDPNNPNSSAVTSQTLISQNLFNEWQAVYDRLDREITRLGINIDEGDYGTNPTATQILAEEENANAFVKQIMEYNAGTTQFAVELTIEMIKRYISKNNSEPINMSTTIVFEGAELPVGKAITMGLLSSELKSKKYFVKVNSRSGALPSNVLQQAQIVRVMQATPPGTPAYNRLLRQYASLNDRDIPLEEFQMAAAPGAEGAPPEEGSVAAETDRLTINPRSAEQMPAL